MAKQARSEQAYKLFAAVVVLSAGLTVLFQVADVLVPESNRALTNAVSILRRGPELVFPGPLRAPVSVISSLAGSPYAVGGLAMIALAAPVVLLLSLGLGRGVRTQALIVAMIVLLSGGAEWFNRRVTDSLIQAFVAKMIFDKQPTRPN